MADWYVKRNGGRTAKSIGQAHSGENFLLVIALGPIIVSGRYCFMFQIYIDSSRDFHHGRS